MEHVYTLPKVTILTNNSNENKNTPYIRDIHAYTSTIRYCNMQENKITDVIPVQERKEISTRVPYRGIL